MKTIYADFQNADPDGFVRLNTNGTKADLEALGINLAAGQHFVLSDGELRADAVIVEPGGEGVWRAKIDWTGLNDA